MRLGKRVLTACRAAGISRAQLMHLASTDETFAAHLRNAEEECDAMLAESLVDVDEFAHYGAQDPRMAAIWSKNVQFYLSKVRPDKFGDKIVVEQKTSVDILITQRLESARLRLEDLSAKDIEIVSPSLPEPGQAPSEGPVQDGHIET